MSRTFRRQNGDRVWIDSLLRQDESVGRIGFYDPNLYRKLTTDSVHETSENRAIKELSKKERRSYERKIKHRLMKDPYYEALDNERYLKRIRLAFC